MYIKFRSNSSEADELNNVIASRKTGVFFYICKFQTCEEIGRGHLSHIIQNIMVRGNSVHSIVYSKYVWVQKAIQYFYGFQIDISP